MNKFVIHRTQNGVIDGYVKSINYNSRTVSITTNKRNARKFTMNEVFGYIDDCTFLGNKNNQLKYIFGYEDA